MAPFVEMGAAVKKPAVDPWSRGKTNKDRFSGPGSMNEAAYQVEEEEDSGTSGAHARTLLSHTPHKHTLALSLLSAAATAAFAAAATCSFGGDVTLNPDALHQRV